jgi:hypothetical protein
MRSRLPALVVLLAALTTSDAALSSAGEHREVGWQRIDEVCGSPPSVKSACLGVLLCEDNERNLDQFRGFRPKPSDLVGMRIRTATRIGVGAATRTSRHQLRWARCRTTQPRTKRQ